MHSVAAFVVRRSNILFTRDYSTTISPVVMDLIIALMVLIFLGLVMGGALYIIRKIRKSRAAKSEQLPQYEPRSMNTRRLTITTSPYGRASNIYVYDEKSSMIKNPSSPPLSPDNIPEIRITFPDEQDESGRQTGGRVVVVRVGETSIGLEPVKDEQLPAYEKETGDRFHSIDMERIGGLKEKSSWA